MGAKVKVPPIGAQYCFARALLCLPRQPGMVLRQPDDQILVKIEAAGPDPAVRQTIFAMELTKHYDLLATNRAIASNIKDPLGPPPRRIDYASDDLLGTTFPDPVWVVPEYLSAGLAMFGGRPKIGKSWNALQLALAVGSGGMFLGVKLQQGAVDYWALEDNPRRLQDRMALQGWPRRLPVTFHFGLEGGLEEVQETIEQKRPRLAVLDTLPRALSLTAAFDHNDNGRMTTNLGPLQAVSLNVGCAALVVDHLKKGIGGTDWLDDIISSTAKVGVPDTIWGLYRERGQHTATLKITGRDLPKELELAVTFDTLTCSWQCVGTAGAVRKSANKLKVIDAIKIITTANGAATTTAIALYTSIDKGNVSRILADLEHDGTVRKGTAKGSHIPYELVQP